MRAKVIDPGRLRDKLALEANVPVADGMGGHADNWQPVADVLALVEPLAALARFGADQTLEETTHRVTLRWRGDVASGMRFAKAGRRFDILTVFDPDETGRYLVCRVKETGR